MSEEGCGEQGGAGMPMNICLYGPAHSGKTSLLQTFAKGLFEATGKKTRVYTGENYDPLQPGISEGYVEVWQVVHPRYPFERLKEIVKGGWTLDAGDQTAPVIPAFEATKYIAACVGCEKVLHSSPALPANEIMCATCKRPVPIKRERKLNPGNGLDKVGAVAYEGLVAFGEMLMDNMSDRSAKGEKIGEDVAVRFQDGETMVAGSSRSSYGIAQRRIKVGVEESRLLPVEYVIWTGLKNRGTDDERRTQVFGPKLVGAAATDDIPRWFGPTLALATVPLPSGSERRIYLTSFFETWNPQTASIENLAGSRIPPSNLEGVPAWVVNERRNPKMLWEVVQAIGKRQKGEASEFPGAPAPGGKG